MKTIRLLLALFVIVVSSRTAFGQVRDLLVNSRSSLPALDRYERFSGSYLGYFPTPVLSVDSNGFSFGPEGNLYFPFNGGSGIIRVNVTTGDFIGSAIRPLSGFRFGALTVDPAGVLYVETIQNLGGARRIDRYVGTTGVPLGTWVPSSQTGLTSGFTRLQFSPLGDLLVTNGNTIVRFRGTDGMPMGDFIEPGIGGLQTALDFVFAPDGRMLVSGATGEPSNRILQFDSNTGEYLGAFASGTLNFPYGMAIGPDNLLYVASTLSDRIGRFDLSTNSFVDTFIPLTAHTAPSFIGFMPIPEPSSLILLGVGAFSAALGCRKRLRNRLSTSATKSRFANADPDRSAGTS